MLFSEMLYKVRSFDVPRWPLALGEVDQTRAFRARDAQLQAQRLRLSITVHDSPSPTAASASIVIAHPLALGQPGNVVISAPKSLSEK
jgi:hypothetical protein